MTLDGILLNGQSLKLRRPKDYTPVPGSLDTSQGTLHRIDSGARLQITDMPTYLAEDEVRGGVRCGAGGRERGREESRPRFHIAHPLLSRAGARAGVAVRGRGGPVAGTRPCHGRFHGSEGGWGY